MSRYIDKDKLLEKVHALELPHPYGGEYHIDIIHAYDVRNAPTADVVEVRHGYWVHNEDHNAYESEYFCSECLADGSNDISRENYCYNCGAKMDGGIDDGT